MLLSKKNLLALKVTIPYFVFDTIGKQNLNFVERGAKCCIFSMDQLTFTFSKSTKETLEKAVKCE